MTASHVVTLTCDVCGEVWDDGTTSTARDARRLAAKEAWRHDDRGDTCPGENGYIRDGLGGWMRDRG